MPQSGRRIRDWRASVTEWELAIISNLWWDWEKQIQVADNHMRGTTKAAKSETISLGCSGWP